MFRSAAEHAGLTFTVEVPDAPVTAAVDRAMWSTIVTNLVSNAVKYTDQRPVSGSGSPATDTDAVLTVADTGPGIDADQQPLVFDRFYRGHRRATEQGAGIGLAVVADLVRAHHGHMDLDSTPGGAAPSPSPCRWTHVPITQAHGRPATASRPRPMGRRDQRCCWSRTTPTCARS